MPHRSITWSCLIFQRIPAEYVRRVGRTARAGRTGTCTVFAYGWQLPIARNIMGSQNNGGSSKLESNFSASSLGDETKFDSDDDNAEYKGGVKARKVTQRKAKVERDKLIKGNIEKGCLVERARRKTTVALLFRFGLHTLFASI